jgi:hypothetical protein
MPIPAPLVARPAGRPGRAVEALETTRRAMRRYRLAMALSGAMLVGLAVAAVVAVLDVSWVLPTWARALGLVGVVASMVGMVAKALLFQGRRFGKGEAAAEVESSFPELGQRLRTTLEYSEPTPETAPASPALVRALAVDTDRQADGLDFPAVVPWGNWRRRALVLTLAIVGLGVTIGSDENLRIAASRLLLLPVHYTTLAVEPGDKTIREGAEFNLRATLSGRPVRSVQWLHRPVGSKEAWTVASLARADEHVSPPDGVKEPTDGFFDVPAAAGLAPTSHGHAMGLLEASRKDCRADFEYRVVAGEVESPVYRVTVTHPLAIKAFEAAIEPPTYTKLKPSVAREGNFKVPEGSKVRFQIGLDRAPASGRIVWTPSGSKESTILPLAVDGTRLTGELPPLAADVRYEVIAIASDGMKLDPSRFLIKVRPDEKPSIKFVRPAESLAATPTTEVPLKVVAGDDYGLAKVGVSYQIGDGPEESLYLDQPAAQPPSVEALTTLYMEKHPLTFADSLSYRAFVEDNREAGHQKVSTELRYIDILPYKQEYEIVEGGGSCNGTSVTLEELILRQRRALNRSLGHSDDQPIEQKVADRLANEEAEISHVTHEFAAALASQFGPIPALDEAAGLMEEATVTLSSRDFAAAIPQEQAALTALTKARMNLRKLLTTSSSSGQCRKIDRAQRDQKIRKPPGDKSKEAELAKLEQDLKKLAEAEKKFAEEVQSKASGGARLDKQDPPQPGKPAKPSGSKPSSSPSEQQKAAAKEAERLKELAASDPALTDLARKRMDEATSKVKDAEAAINAEKPAEAAESAKTAAEELERLAEQVGGLKAKELADKLARARDLARETAKAERELAAKASSAGTDKGEAVGEQQGLAENAKTLADLVKRLKEEAVEEDRTLAQAIGKASETNSPAEIEEAMRQAAASIASGEREKSAQEMAGASKQLDGLARDLETARRDFMQPKLQQLLAAEKEAAEVQKALESATDEARKAEAEKALADLAKAVNALKAGEGPLKAAAEGLSKVAQGGASSGWTLQRGPLKTGLFVPPIGHTNAVREISKALQARIQELILIEALVDRDGPVPPGYKEKVEDYFRLLSEDLR